MNTTIVNQAGITPVSTLEEGGEATMRLITDPALDGVTGQFFDGLKTSRARPEAYDPHFRAALRAVTDRMLGMFKRKDPPRTEDAAAAGEEDKPS